MINRLPSEKLTHGWRENWIVRFPPVAARPGERKRGASNKRVSNRKLRALGWEPKFPTFPIGMERSVLPAYPALGA